MLIYTYVKHGKFELLEKLHIKHGSVPRAVPGIMVGHDVRVPYADSGGDGRYFSYGVGVDGCDCAEILSLIEQGKIDTTPLITH